MLIVSGRERTMRDVTAVQFDLTAPVKISCGS